MSQKEMKDRIKEEIKKAKEVRQLSTEKICEIVKDAVSDTLAETKGGIEELRPVVKDALTAGMEGLKHSGADAKANIDAIVEGAILGARSRGDKAIHTTREELGKIETQLKDEKAMLAQSLREALDAAKETGAAFSGDLGEKVEAAVAGIKLKSIELLGLTGETVKEAVKGAIESGKDVKETVAEITSDATEKALKEGRLYADRIKDIADKVLSAAVEAAEDSGKKVKEVSQGAFEGTQKGIATALETIGDKTKSFVTEDLAQTKKDIEAIEELFMETTRKIAKRYSEETKNTLNELANRARTGTSELKEKAKSATSYIADRMKGTGMDVAKTGAKAAGKAAHFVTEEVRELGKLSLDVAKGGLSGLFKGARDALKKDKE